MQDQDDVTEERAAHYQAIDAGYAAHCGARYPPGHRRDVGDVDLVMLDAAISGCVSTFLNRGGHLDQWRTAVLGLAYGTVKAVVAQLADPEGRAYFQRLADLARLVLQMVVDTAERD